MLKNITPQTFKLILACSFGSLTYGYASGVAGTITAQPSFIEYFNYMGDNGKIADAFNGLFSGGGLIGTLFGGYLSETVGRKKSIFVSSICSVIGAILMCSSVHIAMLYVSRFVMGLGIGMIVMLIPLWQTEVAPAKSRGLIVGMHGVMILMGYGLVNWIDVGFYFCENKKANWRVPLAFQMLWPGILAVLIWYMPESPRWLIEQNRHSEAKKVMATLEEDFTDEKFDTVVEQMANENEHSSWLSLITVPSYRKRLFVGMMIMLGAQATGVLVVINYGPTIYGNLGYDSLEQLLLAAGYITTGIIYNLVSAFLIDIVGRKTLITIGFFGSGVIAMTLETILVALYSGTHNKAANSAAAFCIFLHLIFYGGCVDATSYVYATEIWPTHIRSKGTAVATSGMFIGILAFTTGVSTALNNIGWKFYLIFICLSFVNVFIVHFFLPETKNLSLEEIGALFGEDPVNKVEHVDGVDVDSGDTSSNHLEKNPPVVKETSHSNTSD